MKLFKQLISLCLLLNLCTDSALAGSESGNGDFVSGIRVELGLRHPQQDSISQKIIALHFPPILKSAMLQDFNHAAIAYSSERFSYKDFQSSLRMEIKKMVKEKRIVNGKVVEETIREEYVPTQKASEFGITIFAVAQIKHDDENAPLAAVSWSSPSKVIYFTEVMKTMSPEQVERMVLHEQAHRLVGIIPDHLRNDERFIEAWATLLQKYLNSQVSQDEFEQTMKKNNLGHLLPPPVDIWPRKAMCEQGQCFENEILISPGHFTAEISIFVKPEDALYLNPNLDGQCNALINVKKSSFDDWGPLFGRPKQVIVYTGPTDPRWRDSVKCIYTKEDYELLQIEFDEMKAGKKPFIFNYKIDFHKTPKVSADGSTIEYEYKILGVSIIRTSATTKNAQSRMKNALPKSYIQDGSTQVSLYPNSFLAVEHFISAAEKLKAKDSLINAVFNEPRISWLFLIQKQKDLSVSIQCGSQWAYNTRINRVLDCPEINLTVNVPNEISNLEQAELIWTNFLKGNNLYYLVMNSQEGQELENHFGLAALKDFILKMHQKNKTGPQFKIYDFENDKNLAQLVWSLSADNPHWDSLVYRINSRRKDPQGLDVIFASFSKIAQNIKRNHEGYRYEFSVPINIDMDRKGLLSVRSKGSVYISPQRSWVQSFFEAYR
jgi:hypothetical protein